MFIESSRAQLSRLMRRDIAENRETRKKERNKTREAKKKRKLPINHWNPIKSDKVTIKRPLV